jgi:hypothetical protein
MLISADPRELYEWKERFAEMMSYLTLDEFQIINLSLRGLTDSQIGTLRGVERSAISHRIRRAKQRIVRQMPETASYLAGRRRVTGSGHGPSPVAQGWVGDLCVPDCDLAMEPELGIEIDLAAGIQLTIGIELVPSMEHRPRVEFTLRIKLLPGVELVLWIALTPRAEPPPEHDSPPSTPTP